MRGNKLIIKREQDVRDTLDKFYEASQAGEGFYGLFEVVQNEQVILTAIHNIKANKGSKTAGIDKKVVADYLEMPYEKVIEMVNKKLNNYRPIPVRRHYIPKGEPFDFKQEDGAKLLKDKKVRPLGIPAMTDRIIQEMIRIVLEPILEAKFFPHSYGFRPYRSTEHALAQILKIVNGSKLYWVVEGDIEGYFDNVNHKKLINILWESGIRDKRILTIITKMLKAGYFDNGETFETNKGTPQGGILSPLLSNIYLNQFDWMIGEEYEFHPNSYLYKQKKNLLAALRKQGVPPTFFIRYADDWIILTDSQDNAERLKRKSAKYLKNSLKLNLSEKKTLITDLREERVTFLGFDIKALKRRFNKDEISAKMHPTMKKVNSKVKEIKKDIRFIGTRKSTLEKALDIEKINSKIVGLSNYMRIGISKDIMNSVDHRLEKTAYKTWKKMFGKDNVAGHKLPVSTFANRMERHKGYSLKNFSILHEGQRIGITFAKITKVDYAKVFKQEMSPFTVKGRELYSLKTGRKARLLARPLLYDPDKVFLYIASNKANKRYNLEYFLNREYAFNRDLGKCKICEIFLHIGNFKCHHIDACLPLNEVNKVKNLAALCEVCHNLTHTTSTPIHLSNKQINKLASYRKRAKPFNKHSVVSSH